MAKVYYIDDHEKVCPQCGKRFIVPSQTVYKERVGKNIVPFCSWTCLCAYRRNNERVSVACVPVVKKSRKGEIIKEYPSKSAACKENNISAAYLEARLTMGRVDDINDCYWRYKRETTNEDRSD